MEIGKTRMVVAMVEESNWNAKWDYLKESGRYNSEIFDLVISLAANILKRHIIIINEDAASDAQMFISGNAIQTGNVQNHMPLLMCRIHNPEHFQTLTTNNPDFWIKYCKFKVEEWEGNSINGKCRGCEKVFQRLVSHLNNNSDCREMYTRPEIDLIKVKNAQNSKSNYRSTIKNDDQKREKANKQKRESTERKKQENLPKFVQDLKNKVQKHRDKKRSENEPQYLKGESERMKELSEKQKKENPEKHAVDLRNKVQKHRDKKRSENEPQYLKGESERMKELSEKQKTENPEKHGGDLRNKVQKCRNKKRSLDEIQYLKEESQRIKQLTKKQKENNPEKHSADLRKKVGEHRRNQREKSPATFLDFQKSPSPITGCERQVPLESMTDT